jgi:hypothetical protein
MVQRKGQVGADIAALANRSPRIGVLPPARTAAAVMVAERKAIVAILVATKNGLMSLRV